MNQRRRVQSANTDQLVKAAKLLENGNWIYKLAGEVMKFYKMFNRVHKKKIKKKASIKILGLINHTFFAKGVGELRSAYGLLNELSKYICNCCTLNWEWLYDIWEILDKVLKEQSRMICKIQCYYSSEEYDPRNVHARTERFVVKYNDFYDRKFSNQREFLKEVMGFLELAHDFYHIYVRKK